MLVVSSRVESNKLVLNNTITLSRSPTMGPYSTQFEIPKE